MRNPIRAALRTAKHRKRAAASVVSVGAIGALALGTLGTGVATAHGMVTSGEITNQTIQSQDIGQNGVGASELGPNAVHKWNVTENSVGAYELHPYAQNRILAEGRVQEKYLSPDVREKLNDGGGGEIPENSVGKRELDEDTVNKLARIGPPRAWSMTDLDGRTQLLGDQGAQQVASLDVSGPVKVSGHVTVSGEQQNNNMVCSLTTNAVDGNIAEANEKVSSEGQQNASMTLTGVAAEADTSTVVLNCSSGNGGFATDVSLNATQVAPASGSQPVN